MSSVRPFRLPERAVERRGAIVGGEHVDQTRAVRASGLLRQPCEEAEDLVATRERARHDAVAGDDPRRVLGEQPAEREALLPGEGVEDPSDELGVLSGLGRLLVSHRSMSPSTCRRCASVKSNRSSRRRASAGSSFATAASRCSRSGVGWRSWRRSHRRRLTLA